MKKIVNVTEVAGEGLVGLMGEKVVLLCMNYIYAGKLVGVNEHDVKLEDAKVVYETGDLTSGSWKDAQSLPGPWYVRTSSIESYGEVSND